MLSPSVFETAFNSSPVGEYLLSPTPEATILAVNDAFLKAASRTRDELVGVSLFVAFPENPRDPEDTGVAALRKSLARVIETGKPDTLALQRYPIVVRTADGAERYEERYWSAVSTPIFDTQGRLQCIAHSTMDVTDLVAVRTQSNVAEDTIARLEAGTFNRAQAVHEVNKALQAERSRLRHLFEHAPGFVYFTHGAEHVIEQANSAFYALVGPREVVGKPLTEAFPDLSGQEFVELHDQVYRTGKPYIANARRVVLRRAAGEEPVECYVDLVYQPIVDADGTVTGICGQGNDITVKTRIEEALRASAAQQAFQLELADRLRPLTSADEIVATANEIVGRRMKASRVMYADVDEDGGTFFIRRDWTAEGLSSVAGKRRPLAAFGPEIIASLRAGDPLTVDDVTADPRTASYAGAYAAIGVRALLAIPLVKSGRMVTLLSVHQATARHWTEDDVELATETAERTWASAERARAQAVLRAERDHSQYILDSMTEGFVELDREWRFMQANAEAVKILRRSKGDLLERSLWDVFPDVADTPLGALYRRVRDTRLPEIIEYQVMRSNGERPWIEVRVYPSLEQGLAIFLRDVTDRKRAESELRDASRRKDEFLAMLAHELRNPLAPISAAAELLQIADLDERRLKHSSQVIRRQVRHMTELVDDLLDVSRVTRGLVVISRSLQDIKDVVANAVEQVQPLIEARRHHLAVDLPAAPVPVMGDRKRLVQVLANLLNNAAKYTPPGGDIAVDMEVHGGRVEVHVQDNGIGIAPELVPRVFDLFAQAERTADRGQGGLGLGLALVKSLVELHEGSVRCESNGLGEGSRFTVCLPVAAETPRFAGSERIGAGLRAAPKRLKVLVVDDNVDAAAMLNMLLEACGYEVFVEHDSRRALALADATRPDVALLDIGLPGIDGNELARRIRAHPRLSHVILIAVTGYGQQSDRNAAVEAGFNYHLVKPVDASTVSTLLGEIAQATAEVRP